MFCVNPLGEVYRGNVNVMGSVSVCDVARGVLTASEYERWVNKHPPGLVKKVDAGIKAEFARQARELLNDAERKFANKVWRLQTLNDDRFRIYGMGQRIIMVTEFLALCEDTTLWAAVRGFARKRGAKIRQMYREPRLDKYWPPKRTPNEKYVTDPDGTRWAAGAYHGMMERQVEVIWDVTNLSLPQVRKLRDSLAAASESIWKMAGVSVI